MNRLHPLYHDPVPALLTELCQTPPLRRLRQVGMNCGCEYTAFPRFRGGKAYSRFTHSLGVGLIVWHFTGDPVQAAAGLLHDISTPCFAHVVDFLRGDHLTQQATEAGTRERIEDAKELQAVLARYGLTTDRVADYHLYPIADNDAPRLSADRLEYSLGNALEFGFLTRAQIAGIYGDLTVGPNEEGVPELQFQSRSAAAAFAGAALACAKVYVSPEDRYCMQALSELLAAALRQGILSERDLAGTEPALIAKLLSSPLAGAWERYCSLGRIRSLRADAPPDGRAWRVIPAKKRRIDPLVLGRGRLSALDAAFAGALQAFLAEAQDSWLLAEPADS